jgi:hypothetical protein
MQGNIVLWGVCLAIGALCCWDVVLAVGGNNDCTISYQMLGVEVRNPIFGIGLMVTFATLVGHLCLPKIVPDLTGWLAWGRMCLGLAPIVATYLLLAVHPQSHDIRAAAFEFGRDNLRHGFLLWLAAGYGIWNGAVMVPQHP